MKPAHVIILVVALALAAAGLFYLVPSGEGQSDGVDRNETSRGYGVRIIRDIAYANASGQPLLLDLYLPEKLQGKAPVIVYIHGGGWIEGNKSACPGRTFAKEGYAVACIDYRLARASKDYSGCPAESTFPAQIEDAKAAVRWLRGNADAYGLDADRIAAMGESSGGHLAALLGLSHEAAGLEGTENQGYDDGVQAVVDWYGPVDITLDSSPIVFTDDPCRTPLGELDTRYGGEATKYFYWTRAWGLFLGGALNDSGVLMKGKQASPLTYVDSSDPPFLIMHGGKDGMVPIGQSEALAEALNASGVETTFIRLPEAGHGYSGPEEEVGQDFLKPTLEFLDEYLER